MQLQERRQQRSNRPGEAIQLLLEHTLRNFQLDAIALADEDGLVVSHAGDAMTCEIVEEVETESCTRETDALECGETRRPRGT